MRNSWTIEGGYELGTMQDGKYSEYLISFKEQRFMTSVFCIGKPAGITGEQAALIMQENSTKSKNFLKKTFVNFPNEILSLYLQNINLEKSQERFA